MNLRNGEKKTEIRVIFGLIIALFFVFLVSPLFLLLFKSMESGNGLTIAHYQKIVTSSGFGRALGNSLLIAAVSGAVTTCIGFFLAYTIHFTNVNARLKKMFEGMAILPMILPTITYGFAIIYSFGKKGLITQILGRQLFEIYGFNGLLLGYVIYTLPISFILISNTMNYIDKKFLIVSRVMGDSGVRTLWVSIVRPLLGTLAASFIQSFFLCFTDYGIPASVGGQFNVVASFLYNEMLGSIPNFNNGAVVAVIMLLPSVVSIIILRFLERYNVRYNKISVAELKKNKARDISCGLLSGVILFALLSIFAVIFIIPFVEEWPYRLNFTLNNIKAIFTDASLNSVLFRSLYVALATAVAGTIIVYSASLVTARSNIHKWCKDIIDGIIMVTNTVPGMVLGIAYLLLFSGSSLQNTFTIIIFCNIIHFFSTPYLMMKNTLSKMNASWETTARLMGDNWMKTVVRIVTPNAMSTIVEVFSYYFVNAMVTVSAVIFIAGARTMVLTTKIKELQHYAKFNEIFGLSLLILAVNLVMKYVCSIVSKKIKK